MGGRGSNLNIEDSLANMRNKSRSTELGLRLDGNSILLSARTITIKDDEGKTRGLIRNIATFSEINKSLRTQSYAMNNSNGAFREIFRNHDESVNKYTFTNDGGRTWYYFANLSYGVTETVNQLDNAGINIIFVKSRN